MPLPSNQPFARVPSTTRARLPLNYEAARSALERCERIDECKEWADKAAAIASYAKQADDDALAKMATRIKARAIKRCGELLRAIDAPERGGRPKKNGAGVGTVTRSSAARDAGLSDRRKVTALRVARVPADEFESLVESDSPPTVTALAQRGTRSRTGDDQRGRASARRAWRAFRLMAEFVATADAHTIRISCSTDDRKRLLKQMTEIETWLRSLRKVLR